LTLYRQSQSRACRAHLIIWQGRTHCGGIRLWVYSTSQAPATPTSGR